MQMASIETILADISHIAHTKEHPIVLMMGLSGAGKTHISNMMAGMQPNIRVISFDWWIREPSNIRRAAIAQAYDHDKTMPDPITWYAWEQCKSDIVTLQSTGKLTRHAMWNQLTGDKDLTISIKLQKHDVILIEGMYLMEHGIGELADYIIIIHTDPDTAIAASTSRRAHQSTDTYQFVKSRWIREYDMPYIERYLNQADAVIQNYR